MSENPVQHCARALLTDTEVHPVATWAADLVTGTWTWSPELFALLGFAPGDVVPTAALLTAHRVPAPGLPTAEDLRALTAGEPFARALPVLDAQQRERSLLVAGRGVADPTGRAREARGVVVDLTEWRRSASQGDIRSGIEAAAETRGVIDQAKGALMALYAMTATEAFAALVQHSQAANVKVRELAERVVQELVAPGRRTGADPGLLERIAGR